MPRSHHQLTPDLWLDARRALWFPAEKVLAVADLHLGYAWVQRSRGQMLPLSRPEDTVERLLKLQDCYQPRELLLLGDIVHRALPLPGLVAELKDLFSRLTESSAINCLAGNHDRNLDSLLTECGCPARLETHFKVGAHLLVHGDLTDPEEADAYRRMTAATGGRIIMGHEHPAINLGDGVSTSIKCPCFLVSERLVVLPAFSPWAAGTSVQSQSFLSALAQGEQFTKVIAIVGESLLPLPFPVNRS